MKHTEKGKTWMRGIKRSSVLVAASAISGYSISLFIAAWPDFFRRHHSYVYLVCLIAAGLWIWSLYLAPEKDVDASSALLLRNDGRIGRATLKQNRVFGSNAQSSSSFVSVGPTGDIKNLEVSGNTVVHGNDDARGRVSKVPNGLGL